MFSMVYFPTASLQKVWSQQMLEHAPFLTSRLKFWSYSPIVSTMLQVGLKHILCGIYP